MSRIVPIFAARPKRLRVDRAKSHQTPTPRRGFLATALAGLGLAARPAAANEWIVTPDEPGPLMGAWREVQRLQAQWEADWATLAPEAIGDNWANRNLIASHDRLNAAVRALNLAIAAAGGVAIEGIERDFDPGTGREILADVAVREGDSMFLLVPCTGCNSWLEVDTGRVNEYGCGVTVAVRPIVVEGCFADHGPIPPRPRVAPAPSKVDARLAARLDRYLASREANGAASISFNGWDGTADPSPPDVEARYHKTSAQHDYARRQLISYMIGLAPRARPMACGVYNDAMPLYSQRIGDRLVILKAMGGDGWTSTDPDDIAFERLEVVVIDLP